MGHGDVNAPLPENLRDPVHAKPAAMRFQDLFPILSQRVDLRLLSIATAFGASRDNALRSRPRPRIRPPGVLECGVLRQFGIARE